MKNISEETLPPPPSTAKTNSTINEKNVICKLLHKGDAFELLNLLNAALGRYKKRLMVTNLTIIAN